MLNKKIFYHFFIIGSAISAGLAISLTNVIVKDIAPLEVALIRYMIGSLFLAPVIILDYKKIYRIKIVDYFSLITLGFLLFTLFPLFFTFSLKYTTPSLAAITLATIPIITIIMAYFLKQEVINTHKVISVLLAFLGVIISLYSKELSYGNILGMSLMLGASISAAVFSIFIKKFIIRLGGLFTVAFTMINGTLLLLIISYGMGVNFFNATFTSQHVYILLVLGFLGGAVQFVFYVLALKGLSPAIANIYLCLTPFVAIIISVLAKHEVISINTIVGLFFVISAILIVSRTNYK